MLIKVYGDTDKEVRDDWCASFNLEHVAVRFEWCGKCELWEVAPETPKLFRRHSI